jgi:outer membrane protein insertion porin family
MRPKFLICTLCFCALSFITHAQLKLSSAAKRPTAAANSTQKYTIADMRISGTQYFDEELLLTITGLNKGDEIKLEGDEKITKAILNLWKQNFFSNIDIRVDRVVGDQVFLEIVLQERPRLSKFNFKGVRQAEANDLKEKLPLVKNKVVTEATRVAVVESVRKFFYDKAYLNASVKILERPDTTLLNSVIFTIVVDKGYKTKIEQVTVQGNDNAEYMKVKGRMKGSKEMARLSLHPVSNDTNFSMRKELSDYAKGNGFLSITKTLAYIDPYIRYNIFSASKFNKAKFADDKVNVVDYYNSLGYRDAHIAGDSVYKNRSGNLNVNIKVDEGRKYYFGDFKFRGNTKYSDSILSLILGIKKGDLFNQELLDRRIGRIPSPEGGDDITSLYMDDGYLYFSIDPQETSIDGDTINYELRITEGNQAIIGNIIILGNDKTHEHVIRRELRTLPGTKFSRADLIRSQRQIANLGFFDQEKIGMVPKPKPDGTVDIEYTLVEKSNDQLELQAGFGGQGLGVTGTLGLSFNNFSTRGILKKGAWDPIPSGDGQKVSIRGQANGRAYNSINASFTEPWLGGRKPTALQLSFYRTFFAAAQGFTQNIDVTKNNMVTLGATANIIRNLKWPDDNFVLTYGLNYQYYKLKDYAQFARDLFDSGVANNVFARIALSRYSVDAPLYPRSGSNISFTASFTPPYSAFRTVDPNESRQERFKWIEYHKYRFNADWYHKIKGNLVLRLSTKMGFVGNYNTQINTPFERFQMGGNGLQGFTLFGKDIISQRGYNVYLDNQTIFNKFSVELRYPFSLNPSSTIYGLAFYDAANAWDNYRNYNPFKLNRDAGVGIRVFLPMFGMLGLDYGIRFDSTPANQFGNGNSINPNQPFKNNTINFMLGVEPD